MSQDELSESLRPDLRAFDPKGTALFAVHPDTPESLINQGTVPVGAITRAGPISDLRTVSEEWRASRYRVRRFGWRLEVARIRGDDPVIEYFPATLTARRRIKVHDGQSYKVTVPILRADLRLAAETGDEIARISFRPWSRERGSSKPVQLSSVAAADPLLLVLILTAATAILIDWEEHRSDPGGGGVGVGF